MGRAGGNRFFVIFWRDILVPQDESNPGERTNNA